MCRRPRGCASRNSAWCLQPAPCGRLPKAGVAALLLQLLPGQTWTDGGSTPGMPAPLLVALQDGLEDASSVAAAARHVATVKGLASAVAAAVQTKKLPDYPRETATWWGAFLDLFKFTARNRLRVASRDRTGARCGEEERESSWVLRDRCTERPEVEGSCCRWEGAIRGEGERLQVEGSYQRWRVAIACGGKRAEVEGSIAGGKERSEVEGNYRR